MTWGGGGYKLGIRSGGLKGQVRGNRGFSLWTDCEREATSRESRPSRCVRDAENQSESEARPSDPCRFHWSEKFDS